MKRQFRRLREEQDPRYPTHGEVRTSTLLLSTLGAAALGASALAGCGVLPFSSTTAGDFAVEYDAGFDGVEDASTPDAATDAGSDSPSGIVAQEDGGN